MPRSFEIPELYRSQYIGALKQQRREADSRKQDVSPTIIQSGGVTFKIARHFGFCYGVENAIEIAYRAVHENVGKRVFLLSEMIHNPQVNADLRSRGVEFLQTTEGDPLISLDSLTPDDVIIVPAFGTTLEMVEDLKRRGLNPLEYNATCPFVEKVWKRAEQLGSQGWTIVIHGKEVHEETRATFSHARHAGPSVVIRDMGEAKLLAEFLEGIRKAEEFHSIFPNRSSPGFAPERDLQRIGVVNQTTMLASETIAISDVLRQSMKSRYGESDLKEHFADTRDTLCYATWDNQEAVKGLIASGGDLAVVVGGYNSSNTSHLVELCEAVVPTFYVKDETEILSRDCIRHLEWRKSRLVESTNWWPVKPSVTVLITAGASCPDAIVDRVIQRLGYIAAQAETAPSFS